ncbi:MAG TPA: hypothetical protein PKI15_01825 [Candidatus Cloacimonadota bacterium]|nr:hypothetical protein [Candidatus Cloacimonadota bacterium]
MILLLSSACGIRRSNPLDPFANHSDDFYVPDQVTNVTVTTTGAGAQYKTVTFKWTPNSNTTTDGYYLYRGLAYNSIFAIVDTVMTNVPAPEDGKITCIHGAKPWHVVLPGDYYYKVSAWKQYGDRRLEGRFTSQNIFVRVPN